MSQDLINKIGRALRESDLHRNVSDSFVARANDEGVFRGVESLYADDHDPLTIAGCLARALNLAIYKTDQETVVAQGSGWLLTESGGLYQHNPTNQQQSNDLAGRFGDQVTVWGVLPFANNDGLDEAAFSTDATRANDQALDEILFEALRRDSSDIHLSVKSGEGRVRLRIDGRLVEIKSLELGDAYRGVINRILVRSGAPAGSYISPVSGQFQFRAGDRTIPVRVEQLPTRMDGKGHPGVVMRLLGSTSKLRSIEALGFPSSEHNPQLKRIRAMTRRPNGLVLATGPTGSGKTSTLYAMLSRMLHDAPDRAYASLEDPVEIEMPGVDQVQINEAAGLTFADGLRSLLRKDPDVILVGEIRDEETMNLAIRASLTGHLVLSTLHANSAAASIPRLIDMGCDRRRLADTIAGILAQRVLRKVCPHCADSLTWRQLYTLDHERLADIDEELADRYRAARTVYLDLPDCPSDGDTVLLAGKGCAACNHSGYKGRCIITETLYIDSAMRDMIADDATRSELVSHAIQERSFVEMWGHAIARVRGCEITLDEALDVLEERDMSSSTTDCPARGLVASGQQNLSAVRAAGGAER